MEITLDEGIQIISDTVELLNDKNNFAYFFIVGAGISVPEIPTASKIIEICKEKVKARGEDAYQRALANSVPYESNPSQLYSSWIDSAFPNPINRSAFYRDLIKKAKISSGNLMLAQILQSKAVTNTVFTTNFDDKVEQALDIIGSKDVFSSENKADNLVINVNSEEIQIVHVHGTYRFYDIANLSNEISDVSCQSEMVSSSQVLRTFLQQKAPIVLGYSGWENDVIMKSIKERLAYPIPYKYIWVCYSRKDYESLPDWLKNNNNVSIIIPPDNTDPCNESEKDIESVFRQDSDKGGFQIPATLFLGRLIAQLKIAPPKIFVNPYEYFSSMVENTLPGNEDVLHLKHWAQRMKYHAKSETEVEVKIKDLEIALIEKNFEKICDIFSDFSLMKLEPQDVQFLSKCITNELLEDKYLIKSVPLKAKLLLAILSFVESNLKLLPDLEEMRRLLSSIVFVRFKKSERDDYISILDKVICLTQDCHNIALLNTRLAAIGMKSSIVENKAEQLALLNTLLDEIPEATESKRLRDKQLVALLFKCELVPVNEAMPILETAEKIYKQYSLEVDELLLLKVKAQIAEKTEDSNTGIRFAKECLAALPKYSSKKCKFDILKIVLSISKLSKEQLQEISDVDEKISTVLQSIMKCDCEIENCECTIMVAETYHALAEITSSYTSKLSYYKIILSLSDKFPHECPKYKYLSFITYSDICSLPITIVPDEIKISYLITMKSILEQHRDFYSVYLTTIKLAAVLGDAKLYSTKFETEIRTIEQMNALTNATEMYRNKKFAEAEEAFLKLTHSDDIEVKNTALINLAFMARRNEVTDNTLTFENLINETSDNHIFKHMNLLLYHLQKEHFDLEACQKAYNFVKVAGTNDVESLLRCWGSEKLVGTEESVIGLALINGIYSEDIQSVISSIPNSKYNLDAIKTIIQSSAT